MGHGNMDKAFLSKSGGLGEGIVKSVRVLGILLTVYCVVTIPSLHEQFIDIRL